MKFLLRKWSILEWEYIPGKERTPRVSLHAVALQKGLESD